MKIYAFDVDDTLEVSCGPVKLESLMKLREEGHIVGLCGNIMPVMNVNGWWHLISFFNYAQVKNVFLWEMKSRFVPYCEEYIMVGNIGPLDAKTYNLAQTGGSDDMSQALAASWRFIKESDFAQGAR